MKLILSTAVFVLLVLTGFLTLRIIHQREQLEANAMQSEKAMNSLVQTLAIHNDQHHYEMDVARSLSPVAREPYLLDSQVKSASDSLCDKIRHVLETESVISASKLKDIQMQTEKFTSKMNYIIENSGLRSRIMWSFESPVRSVPSSANIKPRNLLLQYEAFVRSTESRLNQELMDWMGCGSSHCNAPSFVDWFYYPIVITDRPVVRLGEQFEAKVYMTARLMNSSRYGVHLGKEWQPIFRGRDVVYTMRPTKTGLHQMKGTIMLIKEPSAEPQIIPFESRFYVVDK